MPQVPKKQPQPNHETAHSLIEALDRSVATGTSFSLAVIDALARLRTETGYVAPVVVPSPQERFFSTAS